MDKLVVPFAMNKTMGKVAAPWVMNEVIAPAADILMGVGVVELARMQQQPQEGLSPGT